MKIYSKTRFWLSLALSLSLATPLSQGMQRKETQQSRQELKQEVRNNYSLANHLPMLNEAIDCFYTIPGFYKTLQKILHTNDQGHLFELEHALYLFHRAPEIECILAFNQFKPDQSGKEFDIVTNKRWIECKNISWRRNKRHLEEQFIQQRNICLNYNQHANSSIRYQVHSKQEIPPRWKDWFTENHIACYQAPPYIQDRHTSSDDSEDSQQESNTSSSLCIIS